MPIVAPEANVKRFRVQSKQIEDQLRDWEHEIRLQDFNDNSEKCYKAFIELQMSIASLRNEHAGEKSQKECFKITEDLISFFDCNVKTEDLNYIYTNEITKGFAHLWDYLHQYCNDMVSKHEWARKY